MNEIKVREKACSKCKKEKPLSEFYKNNKNKSTLNLQAWCKECYRVYNGTEKRRKYNIRWKVNNKHGSTGLARIKRNVKQRALMAIKRGELVRGACVVCGENKTHGHHGDYSKPFEVTWLCGKHHREWHKHNTAIVEEIGGEQMFPCADCGVLRTKDEGGTTFTVCDKCWDKHYKHKSGGKDETK